MVLSPYGKQISQATARKLCNCKNSRCLKLYCECFASGRFCDHCNCSKCFNNEAHSVERTAAVQQILERNPHAFRPKVPDGDQSSKHSKGCNCKKSGCLKKYCECFQAGIVCSDNCKCIDCKNFDGSAQRANVLQYLEVREQGQSVTPSKRQRAEGASDAGKQSRGGRATPGSTGRHTSATARRPGVLQGVLTPDAIGELCKLLVFAANEVATKACKATAEGAAADDLAPGAQAERSAHVVSRPRSTGGAGEDGERKGDKQLEASLYCNESTEELLPEREASGKAATTSGGKAVDPTLLYEQQEGEVLKEFLETIQSIAALGEQRSAQLQPHQRVLFPDAGQPSNSATSLGALQPHPRQSSAAKIAAQRPWAMAFSRHQQPLISGQQRLVTAQMMPTASTSTAHAPAAQFHRVDPASTAPPPPFTFGNGPQEEMKALQVMHNGQLLVIPASSATWVTMPQQGMLQQPLVLSHAGDRQAVGSSSGSREAVYASHPRPKNALEVASSARPVGSAPMSVGRPETEGKGNSLSNGKAGKSGKGDG